MLSAIAKFAVPLMGIDQVLGLDLKFVLIPALAGIVIVYGVLGGLGFGMVFLPAIICVGLYFESRRALATGIAVCGAGVGGRGRRSHRGVRGAEPPGGRAGGRAGRQQRLYGRIGGGEDSFRLNTLL